MTAEWLVDPPDADHVDVGIADLVKAIRKADRLDLISHSLAGTAVEVTTRLRLQGSMSFRMEPGPRGNSVLLTAAPSGRTYALWPSPVGVRHMLLGSVADRSGVTYSLDEAREVESVAARQELFVALRLLLEYDRRIVRATEAADEEARVQAVDERRTNFQ